MTDMVALDLGLPERPWREFDVTAVLEYKTGAAPDSPSECPRRVRPA